MQDEFKLIDELPPELLVEVAQYLPSRTLINLAERATYYWSLFQPMIHVRKLSYFCNPWYVVTMKWLRQCYKKISV